MIEVWGRRSSINVQKVMWAIAELGVPFERHTVGGSFGGNREPGYLKMNPNGLVPVIRDGDVVMFESNAIVRYLAGAYGEGNLQPTDDVARAAAEQWMEWQQQSVGPLMSTIFMNSVRLPPEKSDMAAVRTAMAKLESEVLPIADRGLADRPWFAGARFSFGDIVLGCFYWRYRQNVHAGAELPNLRRWSAALAERPAYREWVMVPVGRNPAEWDKNERALA